MAASVSSKNLKGSTELTVLAPIRQGLVEIPDPMSYATRLERLLDVLFQQRKRSVELGAAGFVGPLELLRSLHFVHWAIVDQGTRLLLTVAFDKPWEPYIRSIVDDAGPILDVIFFHCEGYELSTTRHGHLAFAKWVRERQQTTNFFFADFPDLSVDDIRFHQALRQKHDGPGPVSLLDAHVDEPKPQGDQGQLLNTVLGLYRLKSSYPELGEVHRHNQQDRAYTDRAIYNRAVRLIAQGYSTLPLDQAQFKVPPEVALAYNDITTWYQNVLDPDGYYMAEVERQGAPRPPLEEPPLDDVQGNILSSYAAMNHGCAVLVRLPIVPAERVVALDFLAGRVSAEINSHDITCNVGFSFDGLKACGLSEAELDALPIEFRDGMENRAGALGDVADHHPDKWLRPLQNWPTPAAEEARSRVAPSAVHAMLVFQTQGSLDDDAATELLPSLVAEVRGLQAMHFEVLHVQPLRRYARRRQGDLYREHFGFLDGISQPVPDAEPDLRVGAYNNQVSFGEVLLGHANDHGDEPPEATRSELLANGSFLAVRKLAQNVEAFQSFVERSAQVASLPEEQIKATLMGRTLDGATRAPGARSGAENNFDYESDKEGRKCPFQSHVRLSNPRQPTKASVHGRPRRVPRLTRRGFSYGPAYDEQPEAERGLLFMAFGANLAEQYEVVQRWLNGGNSTGLPSTQNDPITAPSDFNRSPFRFYDEANREVRLDLSSDEARRLEKAPAAFVKLEWGLYLFAPSRTGLRHLAGAARNPPALDAGWAEKGEQILKRMVGGADATPEALEKVPALVWKKLLEGQGEREKAIALWAAIRNRGGALRTAHGVLIGREDLALRVLKDETLFSSRMYWQRMKEIAMPMHLGMDAEPSATPVCPFKRTPGAAAPGPGAEYQDQAYVDDVKSGEIDYGTASIANALLSRIPRSDAFCMALKLTRFALDHSTVTADPTRRLADTFVIGERVISELSQRWFGLPDGNPAVENPDAQAMRHGGLPLNDDDPSSYCPNDFVVASQYIFRVNPDAWTREASRKRGVAVRAAALRFVEKQRQVSQFHPFVAQLTEALRESSGLVARTDEWQEQLTTALVGAVDGFVAANWGSFVTTIGAWIKSQELWQVQQDFAPELQRLVAMAEQMTSEKGQNDQHREDLENALKRFGVVQRVIRALMIQPVPSWLHRTALAPTQLGGVQVAAGDQVVVNLGSSALDSAAQDARRAAQAGPNAPRQPLRSDMLFGGSYSYDKGAGAQQTPRHACPAQEMGMGVLLGMIVAVLERLSIRAESPLAITFDARVLGRE